jgi:riboflavin kinase/FMN adenylyltransferase
MQATLTILGSGTSMGVPTIGCECAVCTSTDPHDKRTRPSVRIEYGGHTVLIDTGTDFRQQALRENIKRVDAVLYTHAHADHILGLDDLRPLSFGLARATGQPIQLYADDAAAETIERIFEYTFSKESKYPTSAKVQMNRITEDPAKAVTIDLFGAMFQRVPVQHGRQMIAGYRFGNVAYLTDMNGVPESSLPLLQNLDVLIVDALRREPHPSHSTLEQSIALVQKLKPKQAYFTHMSHDLGHAETNATLPPGMQLAYDGLKIPFELPVAGEMNIYRSLDEARERFGDGGVVATIGNFDGVHCGHQWVIRELIERGRALGLPAVAITFEPHPVRVLRPESTSKMLTPLPQKMALLAETGLDAVVVLPFTADLAKVSARTFAETTLRDGLHVAEVHEGENFRFGYQAEVGVDGLGELGRELGFGVKVFAPQRVRGEIVSSSTIRQLIAKGAVSRARALMGRPFSVTSTPAPGRGYGTKYTVPTINLAPYAELLPGNGVYVTQMQIGEGAEAKIFDGVTNVGNRPTFGEDSFTVETYILNFTPMALDESTPLRLTFLHRLRDEKKWPNAEALKAQILLDVRRAERYLRLFHRTDARRRSAHPS